ncbi:hypothetical protein AQS70_01410 [Pseudomonas endophytica]|uniref:Topoisomerase II n=1 Tax=Pseudomonas endophytica TaxID=1563157 RepID=A0A0Q0X313_9PSED|nr:DUF2790 domain-containing protein [Pseudomonas endophytica]KQB54139.1 hypothetical protein AQS70_01410 [Pseudomonas endophytica]
MKTLIALCLASMTTVAFANETSPAVEHYAYGDTLDIAHVISMSEIPHVCQVVPATMTYEDHQGQRHVLEYKVMGDGCSES